jgi:hypothetical protein
VGHPVSLPPVPDPGQVVNVRGSTWAVAEVRRQGLPRSPADEGTAGLTHVVNLQSLEEDRLGQELAVVWELEVGHTVAPNQGLPETVGPESFDDPNTLAAFVDAVRWGAVTSADANSYQAPFRSGANVEAYQLEPLRRALQSSRTNHHGRTQHGGADRRLFRPHDCSDLAEEPQLTRTMSPKRSEQSECFSNSLDPDPGQIPADGRDAHRRNFEATLRSRTPKKH